VLGARTAERRRSAATSDAGRSRTEHRRLRTLFARERLAERAGAEAERAAARALAALRALPPTEARVCLERMTGELAGDATHA
jgi:hypothetical protein